MDYWSIGKNPLDREVDKRKTSFKYQHSTIPSFRGEAATQASKTIYFFNKLQKFRDVKLPRAGLS